MKKPALFGTLIAVTVMHSAAPAHAGKEEIGNIIGGVIGGVIGSQIGGGSGRTAATIIGTIAGSMVGGKVGRNMSEADHRALGDAQRDCFNRDVGSRIDWDGRRYGSGTGNRGSFTSTREGYNSRTGEYCREYESVIQSRGHQERTSGIACSRQDGSWYESHSRDVEFGHRRPGHRRPGHHQPQPGYSQYTGSSILYGITRQSGGQWFRLNLQQPQPLTNIELRVLRANVQLHEASLITYHGQRIPIYELSNTPVLGQNTLLGSYINRNDYVVAIDIRAESYGAYADVMVSVTSPEQPPLLSVTAY